MPKKLLSALLLVFVAPWLDAATSISRNGVTWTWTEDRTTGTFCNGDPWVVGSITLTSISPATTTIGSRVVNGTQINPRAGIVGYPNGVVQGWDSTIADNTYSETANIGNNLPQSIATGSSVCSAISLTTPKDNGGHPQNLETVAILTVLASAPESDAFRPPYVGTSKPVTFRESDIDYSKLRSLSSVSGAPGSVPAALGGPWPVTNQNQGQRNLVPTDSFDASDPEGYSRNAWLGSQLLPLHLNFTNEQKRDLLVSAIQYGIDVWGGLVDSRTVYPSAWGWFPSGGHNVGMLMPMVLAGVVLDSADILAECDQVELDNQGAFGEIGSTFYVTQADVDLARYTADGRPRDPYTSGMIGTAEWGEQHSYQPSRDGSNWDTYYRNLNYNCLISHVTLMRLLIGGEAAVNDSALFDYVERAAANSTARAEMPAFALAMFDEYWSLTDEEDVTAPTVSSVVVAASGATVTVNLTEATTRTAGTPTVTLSGVTLTYSSGSGTSALVFSPSRTILTSGTEGAATASCTLTTDQWQDSAGNDVVTWGPVSITNGSTQTAGATVTLSSLSATTLIISP